MPNKATTISVAHLSTAAHAAAKSAIARAKLVSPKVDNGVFVNPHIIIGIVFRNADTSHFAQYQQVATEITNELEKLALNPQPEPPGGRAALNPQPLPPKESACLYFFDHIIICGYRPVTELPVSVLE